jgi:hypothetical protein
MNQADAHAIAHRFQEAPDDKARFRILAQFLTDLEPTLSAADFAVVTIMRDAIRKRLSTRERT